MAVMVWCQTCKQVVWAYDQQPQVDLRGILNMLKVPCPKCGEVGNFDGWSNLRDFEATKKVLEAGGHQVYDWWSAMKAIAKNYKVAWNPSKDNQWFPQDINSIISDIIRSMRGLNMTLISRTT